ncbi:MAG: EAL domain-containing protein [Aquabacterium sp.]|nr:EAL domain-containing protein [Aquabacterium sp.]
MAAQLPERAALSVGNGGLLGSLAQRLRQRYAAARQHWEAVEAVDGPQAGHFRFRQLSAILQLTPLILVAQFLYVIIVCTLFWDSVPRGPLMAWSVLMVGAGLGIGYYWQRVQSHTLRQVSRAQLARTTRVATLTAFLWACVPAVLFPNASRDAQLIVACVTAGMLCAGAFTLAPVAHAAISFVVVLTAGAFVALVRDNGIVTMNLGTLLLVYAVIVIGTIAANARVFLAGLRAAAQAERQSQTIGLLLHDFEQHASDWLWETDAAGRLSHVSTRLADALGRPAAALRQSALLDLLTASLGAQTLEETEALQTLRAHLAARMPFRAVAVPVQVGDERRWWSLTAKPLHDEQGGFSGWRGVGSDITQARRAHQEMARLANYDALTGLANRHQFSAHLQRLQDAGQQAKRPCALIFLDLDNFKTINDSLGHHKGDRLLQIVARRLLACVHGGDLLARIGGDEFAIISWEATRPEQVAALAQRLLDTFAAPCVVDEARIPVSTSIGIAMAPQDGQDPHTLLKSADLALYAAKAAGRSTFRFFDRQMDERARERLTLQHDLRDAVQRREFGLHFQPQIDLHSGAVTGFEALLRWRHPTRGLVSPAEFIPLAEETGLIVAIGEWVLTEACRQACTWPGELRVAVNLSAVQFREAGIVEAVQRALQGSGLAPQRLELEITESALIQDSSAVQSTLRALREQGVRVAVDDFGTGYSSLAYLRHFPLDKLKIDGMFVRTLEGDPESLAIVRAIVHLAQALGLQTTAEGVETAGQLQAVRELGCTDVQGFLTARPMPTEQVAPYLQALQQPAATELAG